jgi:hypothetical protein
MIAAAVTVATPSEAGTANMNLYHSPGYSIYSGDSGKVILQMQFQANAPAGTYYLDNGVNGPNYIAVTWGGGAGLVNVSSWVFDPVHSVITAPSTVNLMPWTPARVNLVPTTGATVYSYPASGFMMPTATRVDVPTPYNPPEPWNPPPLKTVAQNTKMVVITVGDSPPRQLRFGLDATVVKAAGSKGIDGVQTFTLKIDGAEKFSTGSGLSGTGVEDVMNGSIESPELTVPGAFNYQWYYNGTAIAGAGGNVAASDEIIAGKVSSFANVVDTATPPPAKDPGVQETTTTKTESTPEGTKTTTSTSTGSSGGGSVTTPPAAPKVTTNLNGGATPTANMTKQDFYAAVKSGVADALRQEKVSGAGSRAGAALGGSGSGGSGGGSTPATGVGSFETYGEDSGQESKETTAVSDVEEIKTKVGEMVTKFGNVKAAADSAFARASSITLPSVTGSSLSGLQIRGVMGAVSAVNLAPYASTIGWLRQLQVFIVTVILWRMAIKMVSGIWGGVEGRINE